MNIQNIYWKIQLKDLEKRQWYLVWIWIWRQQTYRFSVKVGVYFSNALSNMDIVEKLMVEFWISEKIKQKGKGLKKKKNELG